VLSDQTDPLAGIKMTNIEEGCRKGTGGQREEGRGRERRGSEGRGRLKFS